jgi:hypothetical protein
MLCLRYARRIRLADDVGSRLRESILNGIFVAGDPFREEELAAGMGVSRGPVGDALAQLDREGLVVSRQNRGAIGAELSAAHGAPAPRPLRLTSRCGVSGRHAAPCICDQYCTRRAHRSGCATRCASLAEYFWSRHRRVVPERLPAGHPLLTEESLLATPHTAFYSEESVRDLARRAAESVAAILSGRLPPNVVNREVLSLPRWSHLM